MLLLALALMAPQNVELTPERCRAAAETVSSYLQLGRQMVATLKASGGDASGLQRTIDADQKRIDAIVRRNPNAKSTPELMAEMKVMTPEALGALLDACATQRK